MSRFGVGMILGSLGWSSLAPSEAFGFWHSSMSICRLQHLKCFSFDSMSPARCVTSWFETIFDTFLQVLFQKKVWTYKTNQNDTNCSLGFQVTFFLCVNCDYHQMAFVFRGPSRPVGVPALFALAVGRGVANPLQTRAGDWGDWQQDLCGVDCWFFSHQRQPNEATWWSSDSRGSLSDPPWWWGGTRQGLGLSRAGRWSSGEVAHPYFFAGSSGREALRS